MKKKKAHKLKQEQVQLKRTLLCFALVAIVIVAALLISVFGNNRQVEQEKPLPTNHKPASYSVEEMQLIWTNNFQEFLVKGIFSNKLPLPKVQERYNELVKEIERRYSRKPDYQLTTHYVAESTNALAGAWVSNDIPHINIIVPRLIDFYYELQAGGDPNWKPAVQNMLLASIMHECEHLAGGSGKYTREHPEPLDELIDEEARAWALTCEYTLKPMIEEYKTPLTFSDHYYYKKWMEIGRDGNNQAWKNFIRSQYQQTRE